MNGYDDANRLTSLRYVDGGGDLLAEYLYELDGVGNRTVVTETLLAPGIVETVEAFLEENGQLVLEAESATTVEVAGQGWLTQTAQSGYAGDSYLQALPDVGQRLEEAANSPQAQFTVNIQTPGDYTVWARGMAPDAGGDSLRLALDGDSSGNGPLTGFTETWDWTKLTMDNADASLTLSSGVHELTAAMREDGLRLDKLLLTTDSTVPSGSGPVESGRQTITTTNSAPQLGTHTIAYSYDPLYRLTGADYSGDISASYAYAYDAVGNMAAYTETLVTDSGTETSIVNRAFNDANQLTSATDTVLGTTSYYYDDNGNMTQILPPGVSADEAGELLYSFSQRNLLTSNRVSMGGGVTNIVATYGYDGSGNRIQQVDHSGDTPVTTTYTNDIMGLTQVLVADDGSQPVYSLLGLDPSTGSGRRLISQDDGTGMRTLLVDGLGSVRQEMAAGEVETTSTYNPYGTLLAQTGTSGTVYGYTGEQEDSATGLVYLRARYYNPALQVFMGKDPWRGDRMRPITQHGYVYGHNSPPNFNDPSGLCVPEGDNGECLPPDDYGLIEGLIDFQGVSGQKWSSAERYEVNKAARQIEKRLADTYNEYMYGFDLSAHVPENILHYVNCSPTDPPLTYIKAFLYFYGKPVLFYKTGTVNGDNAEAYGMYGTTPGGRGINVYRVAKITAEAYGYRWATHEMGHYFEARVNDILGVNSVRNTLGKYANEDLPLNIRIPRRGGDNDEVKYGFADTTYIWQFSDKATTGEEYADMFLGWNYNQWEMRDDNSGFTDLGQARSSFMERYMAPWIALVINRERK